MEQFLPLEARRKYPVCIGGQRAGPPEDCGGPQAYDDRRREAPWRVEEILDQLREALREKVKKPWGIELRSYDHGENGSPSIPLIAAPLIVGCVNMVPGMTIGGGNKERGVQS